jgi:hypothetical protein
LLLSEGLDIEEQQKMTRDIKITKERSAVAGRCCFDVQGTQRSVVRRKRKFAL